ncbi:zinc transporter ZIP11 [Python bivittatus]|uniref:Zinc transporter ZIP11 n=1 Tax=Python bivittatus TaxID=176946 RepID=A0A9F5J0R2_PYTBI|nr:zinc transporter ZIP11 [Python bivittatus]
MIPGYNPVLQALLGTFLTWGLTAAGSALVFIFSSGQRRILDGSLGFAAGVMLAASYWSLLAPAIELAEDSGKFGALAFLPVAVGFTLGAAFVFFADLILPWLDGCVMVSYGMFCQTGIFPPSGCSVLSVLMSEMHPLITLHRDCPVCFV